MIARRAKNGWLGLEKGLPLDYGVEHSEQFLLREAIQKKYYLDREIVPISSDPPTIETISEHLDIEYW